MNLDELRDRFEKKEVKEYPNRVLENIEKPKVSVHISTYNHENYIEDCIEGIISQKTNFKYEIIIGEDESKDETRNICKKFASEYNDKIRLFLHRRENNIKVDGRPTDRFQLVYSHFMCRGKYIAVCDGDDYWRDPKKLQKQVSFLEENKEYSMSFHDAKKIDERGRYKGELQLPDDNKRDFEKHELIKGPFLPVPSLCFRNKIDDYPEEIFNILFSDRFIISMMGERGKGKYQEEVVPSAYREHEGGVWSHLPIHVHKKHEKISHKNLFKYHQRVGNDEAERYFHEKKLNMEKKIPIYYISEDLYIEALKSYISCIYSLYIEKSDEDPIGYTLNVARVFVGRIKERVVGKLLK